MLVGMTLRPILLPVLIPNFPLTIQFPCLLYWNAKNRISSSPCSLQRASREDQAGSCSRAAEKVSTEEVLRDLDRSKHCARWTGAHSSALLSPGHGHMKRGLMSSAWNAMGAFVIMENWFMSVSMAIQTVFTHTTNLDCVGSTYHQKSTPVVFTRIP